MREVLLRPEAESDLLEIAIYIAQDSVDRAQHVIARLRERVSILKVTPEAGRPRPEFGEGIRSLVERPYVILYRIVDDSAEVVAFLHGARDLPAAVSRRIDDNLE